MEKRLKSSEVIAWERDGYTLIATDVSAIVQLPVGTVLQPIPLPLKCGFVLEVGDEVYEMRGPHTAAGWNWVDFEEPVVYQGVFKFPDGYGSMACFTQASKVEALKANSPDSDSYFAWVWFADEQHFMFCTRHMAARIIETDICRCVRPIGLS